jgi:hypothetical protein
MLYGLWIGRHGVAGWSLAALELRVIIVNGAAGMELIIRLLEEYGVIEALACMAEAY